MSMTKTAKKKSYTPAMLREFDRLTSLLSDRNQMVRMNARLKYVPEFVAKHGKEVCDEMFKVLQERDAKLA